MFGQRAGNHQFLEGLGTFLIKLIRPVRNLVRIFARLLLNHPNTKAILAIDRGKDRIAITARRAIGKSSVEPGRFPAIFLPCGFHYFLPARFPKALRLFIFPRVFQKIGEKKVPHHPPSFASGTLAMPLITSRSTRMPLEPRTKNDLLTGAQKASPRAFLSGAVNSCSRRSHISSISFSVGGSCRAQATDFSVPPP